MADLFAMSDKILSEGVADGPINRINFELSELGNDVAMVEAFSHSIVFGTDDGLVVFDTSVHQGGKPVVNAIKGWRKDRFNSIVYTHGHLDHVGGSGAFLAYEKAKGNPAPSFIGHENVPARFNRYQLTDGYNSIINTRQFQSSGLSIGEGTTETTTTRQKDRPPRPTGFLPEDVVQPDTTYSSFLNLNIGGLDIDLRHAKGETDDHTWAWIPKHKAICAGDFFIWNFPNAGNPQKVQRYPVEWAAAMRDMAQMDAEMFLPAHGLPIRGAANIKRVLLDVADVLEYLVKETLQMMNAGARRNDIVHTVKVSPEILAKPYLRPLYDEPEFIVNNIWRMYGGWYDGNPANLKPAKEAALAQEVAALAGGAENLAVRAQEIANSEDFRLACHLIEMAVLAAPESTLVHGIRAEIYAARVKAETSLMARGLFGYTSRESKAKS